MANTQYNFKKSIFEYDTIGRAVVEVTAISSGEENVVGSGEVENGDIVFAVDNKNTPTAVRLYIKNPFGEAYGKDGELLGVGTDVDHINVSNDATVGANLNVSGNTTLEGAVNIRSDVYIGEEYDLSSTLSAIKIETETNTNNKIINGYSTPIHLTSDKLGEVNYPRFDIDWEPDQRTFTVGTANTAHTSGWDISKLIITDQESNAGISIISTKSGSGVPPRSHIILTPGTIDVYANQVNISGSILNTNGSSTFVEYITSPKIVSGKTYQLFLGYRQDISGNTVPHEISMLCREDGEIDKYPVWFHSDGTGYLESTLECGQIKSNTTKTVLINPSGVLSPSPALQNGLYLFEIIANNHVSRSQVIMWITDIASYANYSVGTTGSGLSSDHIISGKNDLIFVPSGDEILSYTCLALLPQIRPTDYTPA